MRTAQAVPRSMVERETQRALAEASVRPASASWVEVVSVHSGANIKPGVVTCTQVQSTID